MQYKLRPALAKGTFLRTCTEGGQVSYTTSSEGHSIFVPLIRIQHAQLDGQLSLVVCDDGEGQSAASLTVKCHHILYSERRCTISAFTHLLGL